MGGTDNYYVSILNAAGVPSFVDMAYSVQAPPGIYSSSTGTVTLAATETRLSADVVSVKASGSSVDKGESLKDTIRTLNAYKPNIIVIRHPHIGAAQLTARWSDAHVVNAGDGRHSHPTQGLLDAYTIRQHKGRIEGLKVAIVGDLLHSRVLRSNIHLLTKMGAEVWVCGPPTLGEAELAANRCNFGDEILAHPLDDAYHRERSAAWDKITVPFLTAANWGGQGLHLRGNFEGYVRAASYGHTLGGAVGLAMIEAGELIDAAYLEKASWEVEINGRRYPAMASLKPLYDPEMKKIKA